MSSTVNHLKRCTSPSSLAITPRTKRMKTVHPSVEEDPTPHLATGLLDTANVELLQDVYKQSAPYKHVVVEKLFQDELLKNVKDECLSELSFTEKQTDIYKVNQTGDLASLSFLESSQIALLPNLLTLRDALYSSKFRDFLRAVTGCGPLSGTTRDMSVNTYTKGCHLLNHDDVIGSRRVSYILYMPIPHYQLWQKEWGGALELYPTKEGPDGTLEPDSIPSKSVSPSWNQFIFFEVQPGRSFHSVEEVVVGGEGEDGRERLSISGWFHAAQEGEEGYIPGAVYETMSSREQLTQASAPLTPYREEDTPPMPDVALSKAHIAYLTEFMNPVYLQPRTMKTLATRFVEESSLEMLSFLQPPIATKLESSLREMDTRDGLGEARAGLIPAHTCGAGESTSWSIKGPPHKWRYCVLDSLPKGGPCEATTPRSAASPDAILRSLQDELFPSPAFRAWLAIVSRLMPIASSSEARRFRPGLDYTLATSEEGEARLDVVLGLTPDGKAQVKAKRKKPKRGQEPVAAGWETGDWGGWECYMAPHEEEDDPAVYRSAAAKHPDSRPSSRMSKSSKRSAAAKTDEGDESGSEEMDENDEDSDDDDSTLLTVQPGFNRLLLVLRDEGVMRFVKYVSASAEGSRWDICGEYEVGMVEEDDSE